MEWYRNEKAVVAEALRRGDRPDLATTMASGSLEVLVQLGWAPVQIRSGSNGRHRHPDGRQEESLPCHPDTLRDALRRIGEAAWLRAQAAGVQLLCQRQLVRGKVYAVDGSGLGDELRLVALGCL